jgi:uncharacterized paraquat-inducible protein A
MFPFIPPLIWFPRRFSAAAKCPHCHKVLPTDDEPPLWRFAVLYMGSAILVVYLVLTLLMWSLPHSDMTITLVQVVKNQWHFVKDLAGRIW